MTKPAGSVHPTAIVDEGAVVGIGTKIWHFCHVSSTAVLGEDCSLGQNVYLGPGVEIGNRVKIQNNVSVFEGVSLEDEVFCGPSAVFTNVVNPRAGVDRKSEFGLTRVRVGASIGANATILCGVEIGRYAFVGAASFVRADIPPFALVVGAPSRQIGWMSKHGVRLEFDESGEASCAVSGDTYSLANGVVTLN